MKKTLLGLTRFATWGAITFATSVIVTTFLHEVLRMREEVAFAVALGTVVVIGFLGCRYLIFENASAGDPKKQAILFVFSSLGFRGSEYIIFLFLHTVLGIYYLVAIVGVLFLSFFAKFFYYRGAVFGPGDGSRISWKAQGRG